MTDKPILFSAPMVRALLDGRKTQTRRLIKWQGPKGFPHSFEHAKVDNPAGVQRLLVPYNHPDEAHLPWGENGYFRHYSKADPDDRFWVKETWTHTGTGVWTVAEARRALDGHVSYAADEKTAGARYWPSIHMPREFSRLTLHVADVRVQRLQDISEKDAAAEGCEPTSCANVLAPKDGFPSYRSAYAILWDGINGYGSWDANPWVFAYTFRVMRGNIIDGGRA